MLCGHEHAASIKEEGRSPPLEMRRNPPLFSPRESPSKNRENLLPCLIGIALRDFLGHFSRFVANFFRGVHSLSLTAFASSNAFSVAFFASSIRPGIFSRAWSVNAWRFSRALATTLGACS